METSEIEGAHGLQRDAIILSDELQQVLHGVGKRSVFRDIKSKSSYRYPRRVIERLKVKEVKAEGQKRTSRNGMIKLSSLSHKRADQGYPVLACLMFQKIYLMYCDINNKEQSNDSILLTRISEHEQGKK